MIRILILPLLLVLLTSCGGVQESSQKIFDKSYTVLRGQSTLEETESGIRGRGKILFGEPTETSHVVYLRGNLEDEGSLGVFFHANSNGVGGVEFLLQREGQDLKLIWQGPFGNVDVLDRALMKLDETGTFGLQMGWSNQTQQLLIVTKEQSKKPATFAIAAEGVGSRWGLELNKASLTSVID